LEGSGGFATWVGTSVRAIVSEDAPVAQ
jgi:hypothetical protein